MTGSLRITDLLAGLTALSPAHLVMMAAGAALIGLAISKRYEPLLLVPIGFGCLVANLPLHGMTAGDGLFAVLQRFGIDTELFPLLIFVGVGAMLDFSPLLARPSLLVLGLAGQVGIFTTLLLAVALGFSLPQAASIGVIGALDGPTSIFVAVQLAPDLLAPIAVAAYSYMSLIPLIQPPLMRLLTTPAERRIQMAYTPRPVSRRARVLFPIATTVLVSLLVPAAAPLVSMLMFGNLLRESGVTERLARAAENELINISTLLLGLCIGATMEASHFLRLDTLLILGLGFAAFVIDTVGGLLLGKLLCVLSGRRLNPLLGAAGISAFPMAARLAAQIAHEEDPDNFLLMHALGANAAGQLASVVAGGALLGLVSRLL